MTELKQRFLDHDKENPILSRLLSMMDRNRKRLKRMLSDVTTEMLDFTPDENTVESIGSLLFHIAAVEDSWIFEDIEGREQDFETWKYGWATRDDKIEQSKGKNLQFYLDRIDRTRKEVMTRLRQFSDADLQTKFIADEVVEFTVEWVCYHLVNHEALHVGQISLLKRLYRLNSAKRD